MTADVFPDTLRVALREKLTVLECSNKLAGMLFDVEANCVADWVSGKTKSLATLHWAKISFFTAGYLDGFMDWLKQEAEDSPEETRVLCRSLFMLCSKIQRDEETLWGGEIKVSSLMRDVNDLLKKTLAEAC